MDFFLTKVEYAPFYQSVFKRLIVQHFVINANEIAYITCQPLQMDGLIEKPN